MNFKIPEYKKLRFYLVWPAAIYLFIFAETSGPGFILAIPVILAGEALRIWAQGTIDKNVKLAVAGPYAYTRNPLYLSNFLIGFGFVLILSNLWYFLLYQVGFFFLYRGTILEEEAKLAVQYGQDYVNYSQKVPRFFPSEIPIPKSDDKTFERRLVWKHGEHITFLAVVALVGVLYLRQEWFQKGKGIFSGELPVFLVTLLIAAALIALMVQRKIKKQ